MAEILDKSAKQTNDVTKKLAINNFKLSPRWLNRFLKCYDLSLRCKTKIAHKLPEDLEDKLLDFQWFVICLRQKNDYPLEMIANMDETPVWFDIVGGLTVNSKGAKTVYVEQLETIKIDSPTTPPPPASVVVWFQEKGWMDKLGIRNTDLAVIPGGLTKGKLEAGHSRSVNNDGPYQINVHHNILIFPIVIAQYQKFLANMMPPDFFSGDVFTKQNFGPAASDIILMMSSGCLN
ncbi:3348_t:CDS:2 [Scutellospora calospora]|uniref:3348_t:CDS:1 n=1 Tax=Scutellospora calospora TaxID=85575 RepID=A0ACA9JVX4_9GLOM|nr:3348_t:CDS:2 [Scutellospora calospora]